MMLEYMFEWCVIIFITCVQTPGTHGEATRCDLLGQAHGDLTRQQQYECLTQELIDPSKYSALVRPVENITDVVVVRFSVQLSQIVDIDEKNQVMKTNVWLQMYWYDYQLKWAGRERYKDVTFISIQPEHVWRPDVVLFNNADGNYEVSYRSNVVLYDTGDINWVPPAIYKSSCSMDVQFFPFDEQQCDLIFGSWTFLDYQLDFQFYENIRHLDVSDYLPSGAWDIVSGDAKLEKFESGEKGENKTMVIFQLVLRRKTLFYTVNLIIPCVLISFVTLSVFILPADAGEKITLCISILLALVVFLLLISKILPPALKIPLISQYLLFTFIMNILAIVCTVVVINRNYRTPRTHQMPYWVRLIFLNYLPKILFLTRPDHNDRWMDNTQKQDHDDGATDNLQNQPDLTYNVNSTASPPGDRATDTPSPEGGVYIEALHPNCRLTNPAQASTTETSFTELPRITVSPEIYRASESLKFIHKHLKKDDDYHTVIDDWRFVARVLDRFLLTVFLIVTITGSMSLFMQAPHIFERIDQVEILSKMNYAWERALSRNDTR